MPPDTPDTPNTKDAAYLWDILEAAREIQDFIKDISITQFLKMNWTNYCFIFEAPG